MATFQVRAVLPYVSGLPTDVAVNSWSVIATDLTEDMGLEFINFYNEATIIASEPVAGYLSPVLDRTAGAAKFEVYEVDVAGGPSGSPIAVIPFDLEAAASATALPPEVALCTSIAAAAPGGTVPARRRGRVYLGPFSVLGAAASGRPNATLVDVVAEATNRLATRLVTEGATLAVWSRTDAAMYPVTRGWVDDEWDTVRSRGREASDRTSWSL